MVYNGQSRQGFKDIFRNVGRVLKPALKPVLNEAKTIGTEVGLSLAGDLIGDLVSGKTSKGSVKARGKQAKDRAIQRALQRVQGGRGSSMGFSGKTAKRKRSQSRQPPAKRKRTQKGGAKKRGNQSGGRGKNRKSRKQTGGWKVTDPKWGSCSQDKLCEFYFNRTSNWWVEGVVAALDRINLIGGRSWVNDV